MDNKIVQILCVLVLTFILLPASQLSAATDIEVTNVSGTFQNVVGGPEPTFSQYLTGVGTNKIEWGIAAKNFKSGYQFIGNAPPTISSIPLDTPFALGTFTHFNYIIYATGGSLLSTDLNISLNFNINGVSQVYNNVYTMLHNETPNVNPVMSDPVNRDIVTFVNNTSQNSVINIGGVDYVLNLIGFSLTPGGPLVQDFYTTENQANSAQLYAQFARVEVPEPATYMLLGAMLFTVALVKQRKRAALV